MKKFLIFVLFAATAIYFVFSQNCTTLIKNKQLLLQDDFNLTKYSGIWYEVRRNKTTTVKQSDCNRANYSLLSGSKDRLNGHLLEAWDNQQTKREQNGILNVTTAGDTKGNLTFANLGVKNETLYWVLKTNYNYSLVYSCCDTSNITGEEHIYILSRNKTIDEAHLKEAIEELKKYEGSEPALITTNQTKKCDKLMGGGVPAFAPSGIVVLVHVLALSMITKLFSI